jgi:hypothetical protein
MASKQEMIPGLLVNGVGLKVDPRIIVISASPDIRISRAKTSAASQIIDKLV